MANICWYQIRVKGKKENAYMMYYATPEYNNKEIVSETGNDNYYTIIYKGDCKWALDAYCTENTEKVDVSKFINADYSLSNDVTSFWGVTLKSKSKMFDCEIEAFAEYEDYSVEDNDGDLPTFEHYKNGETIDKIRLSYSEVKNKLEELFECFDIIHEYETDDDGEDLIEWLNSIYESGDADEDEFEEENTSIFPFKVELYNTQLEGGDERAEKYQVGDKLKLIFLQGEEGDIVRVEHDLGFVGNFFEFAQAVKKLQSETNNNEPLARIAEVVPLSKRSKRCKKPLVVIEVYLNE